MFQDGNGFINRQELRYVMLNLGENMEEEVNFNFAFLKFSFTQVENKEQINLWLYVPINVQYIYA